MSYRQKAAWAGLVTTLLVWGFYFVMAFRTLATGGSLDGLFGQFGIICLSISVLPAAYIQMRHPKREVARPDERERLVEMRSGQLAYQAAIAIALIGALVVVASDRVLSGFTFREPGFLVFHGALLLIVLSELVRWTAQIVLFRRLG